MKEDERQPVKVAGPAVMEGGVEDGRVGTAVSLRLQDGDSKVEAQDTVDGDLDDDRVQRGGRGRAVADGSGGQPRPSARGRR
ncbi:hypothetical protein GCM10012280_64360 [Wenjunlia tyrosinilytica]|uniref:Uncharacterized protein n=1 Tax=Wenjunlia tyrosinilytica TaxID=1544741 RepID=A0A918E2A6_9ACTN|nr:hypothetical protein GCM10012280_64360 [Wenjunlia tyrosinilytica]